MMVRLGSIRQIKATLQTVLVAMTYVVGRMIERASVAGPKSLGGLGLAIQLWSLQAKATQLPVRNTEYPTGPVEYLNKHGLNGRMIVAFEWSQYLLSSLAPEGLRFRAPSSGSINGLRVKQYMDPELVLLDRRDPHARRLRNRLRNWSQTVFCTEIP